MVQQRSGRWVLAAIGRSPKEGRYTFRKLDQNSGLVLDGGEEVARLICKVLSDEELKWSCSGSLREVKITKSELMKEMQSASNEGAYFVIPSQLNGIDSPNPNRVLKCLEECKSDEALFKRRGVRGHLAVHPAVGQFLLDNAGGAHGNGLNTVGKVLESIHSDQVEFQNGFLKVNPNSDESLRLLVANLHKMQPLVLEDVPAAGLRRSKTYTAAVHCVHLAFASTCPVDPSQGEKFQELSETLLAVQYLGALRRAAEKAVETRRKQKVFLVPPGEPCDDYCSQLIAGSVSRAIGLLKNDDFSQLEVHLLLEDENEWAKFAAELSKRHLDL